MMSRLRFAIAYLIATVLHFPRPRYQYRPHQSTRERQRRLRRAGR